MQTWICLLVAKARVALGPMLSKIVYSTRLFSNLCFFKNFEMGKKHWRCRCAWVGLTDFCKFRKKQGSLPPKLSTVVSIDSQYRWPGHKKEKSRKFPHSDAFISYAQSKQQQYSRNANYPVWPHDKFRDEKIFAAKIFSVWLTFAF